VSEETLNSEPLKRFNGASRRIEAEPGSTAFGVGFGLAPALLRRCLKRSQAPNFLEDALGIQLVFESLQSAIHWLTFANDHFWHRIITPGLQNYAPYERSRAYSGERTSSTFVDNFLPEALGQDISATNNTPENANYFKRDLSKRGFSLFSVGVTGG
jgi:hypothetical protein